MNIHEFHLFWCEQKGARVSWPIAMWLCFVDRPQMRVQPTLRWVYIGDWLFKYALLCFIPTPQSKPWTAANGGLTPTIW